MPDDNFSKLTPVLVKGGALKKFRKLTADIKSLQNKPPQAAFISDISTDLGDIYAGRFIATEDNVTEPSDPAFSGVFISASGELFEGSLFNIGGVNTGVLQFGLSAIDGKAYAGEGRLILDSGGLKVINKTTDTGNPYIYFYERDTIGDNLVGFMVGDWDHTPTNPGIVWTVAGRYTNSAFDEAMIILTAPDEVNNFANRVTVSSSGYAKMHSINNATGVVGSVAAHANGSVLITGSTTTFEVKPALAKLEFATGLGVFVTEDLSTGTDGLRLRASGEMELKAVTAPNNPGSGYWLLMAKSDGLYQRSSSGVETALAGGGGAGGDGAKVSISSAYSLADSTEVNMQFDTEEWDSNGLVDLSSYTTRITIQTTGKYLVTANAGYALNTTGSRRLRVLKNGTDVILNVIGRAANTLPTQVNNAELVSLTAGDYIQLVVWQDSGGALSVNPARLSVQQVAG